MQSVSTLWGSCLCVLTFSGQSKGVGSLAWQSIPKLQLHDKKCCQHGNDLFKHLLNHFTTNSNTWSVILTFRSDITSKQKKNASQTVLKSSSRYYVVNIERLNYSVCSKTNFLKTNLATKHKHGCIIITEKKMSKIRKFNIGISTTQ